ncbi:unnamed protein product [Cyprideis torosa]|uniref:Uncharacterized protein n=1 Tax=Cyprideis torosa TaxID=163714 RepID=A0A7R8WKX8_9CRUS|nr:unnamed protein product [Cyprideis torosa]CAG0903704.1 unnamed protein product [Cyprideis torosa]
MPKILIVEDEKAIREVLKSILSEEDKTYEIEEAGDGLEGFKMIQKEEYDLIICDIKMPKMDGMEVLKKALEYDDSLSFLMISGHGDIETAINSIKMGAYDYISKPPDLNRLLNSVKIGLERRHLVQQNVTLKKENKKLKSKISKQYQMVGESQALKEIQELISRVGPTDARVLIMGPNGSGKEMVAHQIHENSDRSGLPIIEVNCAAIPSELIESELFGHMKGSFTGAVKDKKGKFELADKGTLFLDEVGDMSLAAQAKVLRALQEVIPIFVPPLSERKEDIPLLIEHFLKLQESDLDSPHGNFALNRTSRCQKRFRVWRHIIPLAFSPESEAVAAMASQLLVLAAILQIPDGLQVLPFIPEFVIKYNQGRRFAKGLKMMYTNREAYTREDREVYSRNYSIPGVSRGMISNPAASKSLADSSRSVFDSIGPLENMTAFFGMFIPTDNMAFNKASSASSPIQPTSPVLLISTPKTGSAPFNL